MSTGLPRGAVVEQERVVELDRRAVEASRVVARAVVVSRLDDPTPCAEWTVRQLLEHMIVQHHGFARAAEGARDDVAAWAPVALSGDPAGEYDAAAGHVLSAFAGSGGGPMFLAEIRGGIEVPAAVGMSFHLLDYVAHTWDLAQALGVDAGPLLDGETVAAALVVAARLPSAAARTGPDATFAPVTDAADGTELARFLALTGRSAAWRG